ncbi:Uncharacterized protein BP5553_08124 [Venustampulla echinocandica]|uniref:NAD(P)-binding protein n=1 Tax=Venustampulla echinocandica TaxID=2656787 RepID=A0A370TFT6_9HELO|nr:Uncharacterized protein BP5553_08124 [Venustampulla echinocandica]RDL33756.1 Uncharacterized protein BP5553_08124 [Venustampulla echinocandica]
MGVTWSQLFPPQPTFTEKNLPSQKGKVFIVTGGTSGVGFELANILFKAGGKVYIAARSKDKALKCIEKIKSTAQDDSSETGQLEFLHLELDDLSTIKASAEAFKSKEPKLDVLWNNAGVSLPPLGSKSKQGYELQMGINCLGAFLFTELLLPPLKAAAQNSPPGTVRVIWTSSQAIDNQPRPEIIMAEAVAPPQDQVRNYTISKIGNWFLASELAKQVGSSGIISVTQNPGNLNTELLRNAIWYKYAVYPILYKAIFGAYTELWAGLSPDVTMDNNGCYVLPWGRIHPSPSQDILRALKGTEDGGTGRAKEFREWCEKETSKYM